MRVLYVRGLLFVGFRENIKKNKKQRPTQIFSPSTLTHILASDPHIVHSKVYRKVFSATEKIYFPQKKVRRIRRKEDREFVYLPKNIKHCIEHAKGNSSSVMYELYMYLHIIYIRRKPKEKGLNPCEAL